MGASDAQVHAAMLNRQFAEHHVANRVVSMQQVSCQDHQSDEMVIGLAIAYIDGQSLEAGRGNRI